MMAPDVNFQQLAGVLRRRKGLILGTAAFGAALAAIGGLVIPPRYAAVAQIEVDSPLPLQTAGQPSPPPADESAVETEEAALSASDQLRRLLDSLWHDPQFQTAVDQRPTGRNAIVEALSRRISALLPKSSYAMLGSVDDLPSRQATAGGAPRGSEAPGLTLDELEHRLLVQQDRGSRVISLRFTAASPIEAAMVVNRAAQLDVERRNEQKRARAGRALTSLEDQIGRVKDELRRDDATLWQYRRVHGLSESDTIETVAQQLPDLNRQLTASESELAGQQARLAHVRELQQRKAGTDALIDALGTPTLLELRSAEAALLQSEAQLAVTIGDENPKMQQVHDQLQEVRAKISREVDAAADDLESRVQILSAQMRPTRERIAAMQAASTDVRLRELERDAADKRQVYLGLLRRQTELRGEQGGLVPDVRVLSLATPPDRPSSPNPILFIFPALIAFGIFGGLMAVAAERLDQGLRGERDVSDALGIPCIGLVPQLRNIDRTRPHHRILEEPFARYTEAIRSVVAALHLTDPRGPKAILISSSVPGEGKTTLAVSVAVYAALLGRRVLLVDLDFRHPAIPRELDAVARDGILDLLVRDRPPEEVVQHIPALQLDYLPACQRPVDPLPLFADARMPRLLNHLRESYDCVVIDSPPLLFVTEARLLAAMVDKVVLAVKWGTTRRDIAQNALTLLRNLGLPDGDDGPIAGAVVTQADMKKHARYRYGDIGESVARYPHYYPKPTQRRWEIGRRLRELLPRELRHLLTRVERRGEHRDGRSPRPPIPPPETQTRET
jgi:polysaccharide biosynthesis transport protein